MPPLRVVLVHEECNQALYRGALNQIITVLDVLEQQVYEHIVGFRHVEMVHDSGKVLQENYMFAPEGDD
jgi:hypothetical protein